MAGGGTCGWPQFGRRSSRFKTSRPGSPFNFLDGDGRLSLGGERAAAGLFEREPAEGRNGRERGEDDGSEMAGWSMKKNRGRWLCQ